MNTSVTEILACKDATNSAGATRHEMIKGRLAKSIISENFQQNYERAGNPSLPPFMREPIDTGYSLFRVSAARRLFRGIIRIGSLSAAILAAVWLLLDATNPAQHTGGINEASLSGAKPHDSGLILGTAISQAFAADTAPTGPYSPADGADTYGETMTPEELKSEMQRLQKEIEMIERQSYDLPGDMNLMSNDSLLPLAPETLIEASTDDLLTEDEFNEFSNSSTTDRTDISTPRWEEPLTPPRWREPKQHGQTPGGEGRVTSLDPPAALQWPAPPQWTRTITPEMEQNQYGFMPEDENNQMAMQPTENTGAFRIQLGSFRSTGSAQSGWRQLLEKNQDLLGALDYSVEQADLGQRGVYYRLHAGSFADISLAKVLCGEIKARNTDCLVIRR